MSDCTDCTRKFLYNWSLNKATFFLFCWEMRDAGLRSRYWRFPGILSDACVCAALGDGLRGVGGGVLSGGSGAVVVVLFLGLGHLGCLAQHSLGCWSRARVLRWGCPNIRPFQVAESPNFVHWLKSSFFLSLCLWCRPGYNSIWLLNGHLFQSFLNTLIFTSFLWNLWLPETKRPLVPQSFP